MKKLIRILDGEPIPDGAKFIESVTNKIPTHTSREYIGSNYGLFITYDNYRIYQHYRLDKYYIYEVNMNEEVQSDMTQCKFICNICGSR